MLKPGANAAEAELIKLVRDAKGVVRAPKSIEFVEELPVTGLGRGGVVVKQLVPPSGNGKLPGAFALNVVVMAAALGRAFWWCA